jgi:DNA-binding CsgD family transcriptional regulator
MISTPQTLRQPAIRQDVEASRPLPLGRFWDELCRGTWLFRDTFSTEERCFALLQSASESPPLPLNPRQLHRMESVLLGTPPKVVAMDSGRSLSSITMGMQDCLRRMGLNSRSTQASVLLTMAARARHRPEAAPQLGRESLLEVNGAVYRVVSALRPDLQFPVPLSLAEAAVVRRLVAGDSYAEISGRRATSPRTVANQLATAFRKLGVSGRRAALGRLIQHSAQQGF